MPGVERPAMLGPDLSSIGTKVSREWIYKWLKEPRTVVDKDANVTVVPVASVTVPDRTLFVAVLRFELALKFTTVAEKLAAPAPLTPEPALKLNVPPPEKTRVAPPAAAKVPLCVPPPEKVSLPEPVMMFTVPVLLNATATVKAFPPVIWKVPALLKVPVVAPLRAMLELLTIPQVAPARLLITAPFCRNKLFGLVKLVAPDTFRVRVSRKG